MEPEDDYFEYALAVTDAGAIIQDASAQVYETLGAADPLPITDMHGIPVAELTATRGVYPRFKVPTGQTTVYAKSGEFWTPLTSKLGARGDDGVGIADVSINVDGELILVLTSGDQVNAGAVKGDPGAGVNPAGSTSGEVLTSTGPTTDPVWGAPPRQVQLRATSTALQWQYVGDTAWNTLVPLADLKGDPGDGGDPGAPGPAPEMRVADGYVQWKRDDSATWLNLIALADLGGGGGATGYLWFDGTSWSPRPVTDGPVIWASSQHAGAPMPPMSPGDIWIRHPDDVGMPA